MEHSPDSKAGTVGWALLGGFVMAWDILAPETLSGAVDRALEHPVGKYAAIGATAVLGAHLLNVFEHFDIPDPVAGLAGAASTITESMRGALGHGRVVQS